MSEDKIQHMDNGLKRYFAEFFPDKVYNEDERGFAYVIGYNFYIFCLYTE